MSRRKLFIGLWVASIIVVCLVGGVLVGWSMFYNLNPTAQSENETVVSDTMASPTASTPPPISTTTASPLYTDPVAGSIEADLVNAVLPIRDQRLLAMRLKYQNEPIPEVVRQTPLEYQLGETTTFWVTDNFSTPPRQFQVQATLRYKTDHSYWWVENGFDVSQAGLQQSAEQFEQKTYPTNRAFFGSEWSPGIDGDVRIHVFMGNVPGVAGYFSASNSYSTLAESYSNEREMFFINLNAIRPGQRNFDGVLSHEFQHMIHWHQDRNEDTWVNEGLSELATYLNGYGQSNFVSIYLAKPDTQLNTWAVDSNNTTAHYGGSFLFMAYFLEQYGEAMMQAAVAHQGNGIAGFNQLLAENGYDERFNTIFADFLIANYLNDPTVGQGKWGYRDLTLTPVKLMATHSSYPVDGVGQVHQYGGDYIELSGTQPMTISFKGNRHVSLVDNQAYSGQHQWYSHRGDDTNTRLTRAFDLTAVDSATLTFWMWYDIEPNWDYAYLSVSTDEGQSWTLLQGSNASTTNPAGNAYGPGYTGNSGGWIQEQIDLSAYSGQQILLRFEQVTDDAVNHPGLMLDDIQIPEIDFFDDVESGLNGWQAEGFVRVENNLPQHFLVQLLKLGDTVSVEYMALDETNAGTLVVDEFGTSFDEAVLIISGLTLVTTEAADYEYTIITE